MKVLGEPRLAKFSRKHPPSRKPLQRFLEIVRASEWKHFPAVKESFPAADYTPSGRVVFDIGGNKYRVIATISFERQELLIEAALTHEEYNREAL